MKNFVAEEVKTMDKSHWVFISDRTKDMVYYYIAKYNAERYFEIIFNVQLPLKNLMDYGWSDYVEEMIQSDIRDFIEILPKYMQDICMEHNGLKRINEFPDYQIGHMEYSPSSICIGGDGKHLQIAGCYPGDVGEKFVENFVKGLKGEWKGINFNTDEVIE